MEPHYEETFIYNKRLRTVQKRTARFVSNTFEQGNIIGILKQIIRTLGNRVKTFNTDAGTMGFCIGIALPVGFEPAWQRHIASQKPTTLPTELSELLFLSQSGIWNSV